MKKHFVFMISTMFALALTSCGKNTTDKEKYLDVELYDVVKNFNAAKDDPSVENIYLNKRVHFFATCCGCSVENNIYLQKYCQTEDSYYGIYLYTGAQYFYNEEYKERGALFEIYGLVSEYGDACQIEDVSFNPEDEFSCKVVKTASENTDPLTELNVLEYSASDYNRLYLANDRTILSLPIKIKDHLKIQRIETTPNYSDQSIYKFENYDFSLSCTTIEDAHNDDYLNINYSIVHPRYRSLNNTFGMAKDIVLLK